MVTETLSFTSAADLRGKYRNAVRALRGSYRSSLNPRSRVTIAAWSLSGDQHADAYSRRYSRELARDLERNAGAFVSLFNEWVKKLVGDGVRPRPTTASEEWNQRASELIHARYSQVMGGMDVREHENMYGLQGTIVRSIGRDGDMGVLKMRLGQGGKRLALQCFESEQIDFSSTPGYFGPASLPDGAVGVVGGVALNQLGARVGYYGCPYDQAYNNLGGVALGQAEYYPAKEFLFSGIVNRYSQTRGVPLLVSVLDDFERVDSYVESEVIAAEQGSQIYGALQFPPGMDPRQARGAPTDEDPNGTGLDGGRNSDGTIDWQPTTAGSLLILPFGATYVGINPNRPNREAEPFLIAMLRQFCAVTGLPYEITFNDLRGLSWSTARSLVASGREAVLHWQKKLLGPIFSDIYRWVIGDAIATGKLPKIDGWDSHDHEWPVMDWPDPEAEVVAQKKQYDLGTTSLSRILGRNWQSVQKEQAAEQMFKDQLNLDRIIAMQSAIDQAVAALPSLKGLTWQTLITLQGINTAPGAWLEAASMAAQPPEPAPERTPTVAQGREKS